MAHDPSKPHRRSIRLKDYDYSQPGAYFVTVCTQHRECLFGEIVNGEMRCSTFGDIVTKWWNELPRYHAPVVLDAFVVMPNHLHGILVIAEGTGRGDPAPTKKRTLGQLMGYLKYQISKEINALRETEYANVFQRNYLEHIIRNNMEWNAIADYISANPMNWNTDIDNPTNFPISLTPPTTTAYLRDAGLS